MTEPPAPPQPAPPPRIAAEYILPLRWSSDDGLDELTAYLRRLREWVDVTVVDGSDPERFAVHALAWQGLVRHAPVAVARGANGKVRGVLTGITIARHEAIVIADDDVRYEHGSLAAVVTALQRADLVKPQNHFQPLPWHARWDTARTLLNRGLGSDYPGTYGVRRSTVTATGGYDADVLFENLELERTVRAAGGVVSTRPDILVVRRPPSARHFVSQRVRQAYDSFAQPWRLVLEASILPVLVCAGRRPAALVGLLAVLMAVAERGRRRHGGRAVFPASSILWVPFWIAERGVATWIAIGLRLRGGVRYSGRRLARAAHPVRTIRRRLTQAGMSPPDRSRSR
ncbi:glycosyltransferase family 2 protein [Microbacterium sp. NPDC096154]|uniref:glycosyltransferase n=1 Tax=Microbacterium sp. NPDC096154 TaxID=3155549 RepID=UPI003327317B